MTPVQCSEPIGRLFAGLGALAAILALTLVATPAVLELAAVFLTGLALYSDNRGALQKFAAINGVAILLLTWAHWSARS